MERRPVVLVVDSEADLRHILSTLLDADDYTVIAVGTGSEAVDYLHTEKIDFVIFDWMLPDMDGGPLCKVIRSVDAFMPILVLTALTGAAEVVRILQLGADDYVHKPFSAAELLARIRALQRRALATRQRNEQASSDAVAMHFSFPDVVKVACEQYLLYFVEFLSDIGIEATADLREDAGQVLFSVKPKNKGEALDNIWEALGIYLRLPMNRAPVVVTPETDIAVQKLTAQLRTLEAQFHLAGAALQLKELTIRDKDNTIRDRDTTIAHQRAIIDQQIATGQILVDALQEETEDSEPLGTELIRVKRFSWDWILITVELPELIRLLKARYRCKRLP